MAKINALQYDKLYNSESKKEFIEQYSSLDSRLTLYWQFLKVAPFEREKGKDMSEMTDMEIKEMLEGAECSTLSSAINHINTYKRYIETVSDSDTSPFYTFSSFTELASEVVANYKNKRYTREELMFMIDELANDTDKALLLALFEGIKGKGFSELLTLKMGNVDVKFDQESNDVIYTAKLYDEAKKDPREINISKELYKLLDSANMQPAYRTNNQDEDIETPFNESEYVFKKAKKGKQNGEAVLDRHFITRKFIFFKAFFGNTFLTADDIVQSGMMHMAYELYKENGKIGREELLKIGDHYDTIMTTNDGKNFYRNATVLKRIIFNEKFTELYGDIKYGD